MWMSEKCERDRNQVTTLGGGGDSFAKGNSTLLSLVFTTKHHGLSSQGRVYFPLLRVTLSWICSQTNGKPFNQTEIFFIFLFCCINDIAEQLVHYSLWWRSHLLVQNLTPKGSPHATTHNDRPTLTHLPTTRTGKGWKSLNKIRWVIRLIAVRFSPSQQLYTMWSSNVVSCYSAHAVTHHHFLSLNVTGLRENYKQGPFGTYLLQLFSVLGICGHYCEINGNGSKIAFI